MLLAFLGLKKETIIIISQENCSGQINFEACGIYLASLCCYLLVDKINLLSFSFSGVRNDLEFLLEEELSSINLCALHCELRNTEQLLASLGLFAFKVGSLEECNTKLASYDPENFSDRISVKMKQGQETAVQKHNIQVSSFSGIHFKDNRMLFGILS